MKFDVQDDDGTNEPSSSWVRRRKACIAVIGFDLVDTASHSIGFCCILREQQVVHFPAGIEMTYRRLQLHFCPSFHEGEKKKFEILVSGLIWQCVRKPRPPKIEFEANEDVRMYI